MKRLIVAVTVLTTLTVTGFAQTTSGSITTDETWSGTVTITGDVIVTGATLTIAPGAVIKFGTSNDNLVFGGSSQIVVACYQGGAVRAEGSADSRITFSTTSPFAAAGAWGYFLVMNGSAASAFSYCDWEYGKHCALVKTVAGNTDTAAVDFTMDNCTARSLSSTALYVSSGNNAAVSNCDFRDTGKFFFFDGSGTVSVNHTYLANSSAGFVLTGTEASPGQNVTVDHVTMYNVDMMLTGSPTWWSGYGVFGANTGRTATFTNCIMVQSTLANIKHGSWTMTENHNCLYTGMLGLLNYENGTPDSTDIVGDFASPVDPLFVDAANGDFRLAANSPCLDAASDGTNMGTYQGPGIGTAVRHDLPVSPAALRLPNPVARNAAVSTETPLTVYSMSGQALARHDAGMVRPAAGLAPGIYRYTNGSAAGTFIVAD